MKFTDLILLVGTNPLPNAVVASYFIQKNPDLKKIWLIHTGESGTKQYADSLKEFIVLKSDKVAVNTNIVINNPAEKRSIEKAFDFLFEEVESNSEVHLNYTGGTKTMGVHSYRFIENKKYFKPTFSYLDSDTFRLYGDNLDEPLTDDLRNEVKIKFEEMYKLHGYKGNSSDVIFENANKVFEEIIKEDKLDDFYFKENNGGYTRKLFEDKKGKLAKKVGKIKHKEQDDPLNLDNFKINEIFGEVVTAMIIEENKQKKDYRLFKEGKFDKNISNKLFEKAVKYLDGKWLEQVVFSKLTRLLDETKYKYEIEISSNIKHNERPDSIDFEIDLVMIRGYQLIGISCTTSRNKSLCKSKGFEVIHRARQIGGDEAKVILVTMLDKDKVDRLERTLQYDIRGDKVCVLGKDDLKDEKFKDKVLEFLGE